ncbi:hypothetical protein [Vibrio harveyi]|uniref:hypothetical protein n=1 Tax=Vibrio harveyi TaxID=669 RepID=UPI003CFA274F
MNDYGFLSAKKTKAVLELGSENPTQESLSMLSHVNPVLRNNQQAFSTMMSDPDGFEIEYGLPPLSPYQKNQIADMDLKEMGDASVGELLFKTSLNGKIRLPGDKGYEEWNQTDILRKALEEQVKNASTQRELTELLSAKFDASLLQEAECSKVGGFFLDSQTNVVQTGYDRCMKREDYGLGM